MHGCLDNGSLATSSYLRNANIKTYVEECIRTEKAETYYTENGSAGSTLDLAADGAFTGLLSWVLYELQLQLQLHVSWAGWDFDIVWFV